MIALLRRYHRRFIALALWVTLIGGFWWYARQNNLSAYDVGTQLHAAFVSQPFGPLLFIVVYAIQPVFFFPSSLLSVLAGCFYGPTYGVIYTLFGALGAAMVTYSIGRYFGDMCTPLFEKYTQRLYDHTFETVLVMHLIFLPYDLTNYVLGFLRVPWKPFILGTALGSIPGIIVFVLFGASIEGTELTTMPTIDWQILGGSIMIAFFSVTLSWYLRRMYNRREVKIDVKTNG